MFNVYHEFVFDERSQYWDVIEGSEYNLLFVRGTMRYCTDEMRSLGYIYLNDIYEKFGVAWNPNDDNVCYTMTNSLGYLFSYQELPNNEGFKICVGREVG